MAQVSCGAGVSVVNVCMGSGSGSGSIVVQVSLPDNAMTPVNIPTVGNMGSYILLVNPSIFPGASATFNASKSDSSFAGSAARITNSPSPTVEEIDIVWSAGNPIQLFHSILKAGGTGALITYKVKIISL